MSGSHWPLRWPFSQPLFAHAIIARIAKTNYRDSDKGFIVTGFILCGISVLTSTAISEDRLLALMLCLRYRHVVTLRRTRALIACFFVIGISSGLMYLWNKSISRIAVDIFGIMSLITSIFCFCVKIYSTLRQQQSRVQELVSHREPHDGGTPLNIARYKNGMVWYTLFKSRNTLAPTTLSWFPWGACFYKYKRD